MVSKIKAKTKKSLPKKEKIKKIQINTSDDSEKKPKLAIISLTSCEGCQFALLDLGQRFLDLAEKFEMVDFRLLEDEEDPGIELDLVLIEGNPVTEDNIKTLLAARKRAKLLCALGNCAAMGGIPEIKNYQDGTNTIKHVYRYLQGIYNPEIKEIDNFVKVDFTFPGCPINGEEFLKYVPELLNGNVPAIPDSPVCVECKKKGNRCLLLDKKPCFGPMIIGGCDAVCPTSRMMCQGCRGLRPGGNVKAMKATLKSMMSDAEFENTTEIYGLRDDIEDREKTKDNLDIMDRNKIQVNLIIDFDSTFVKVEALDELARIALAENIDKDKILDEIKRTTILGMEGKITFPESLGRRFKLLSANKGHVEKLIKFLKDNISESVKKNRDFFVKNAGNIYIISGGFAEYIVPVAEEYGIRKDHILANKFIFDDEGNICGFDENCNLAKDRGKAKQIREMNLAGETWVVGDGYTDYQIKEAGSASKFIAFCENVKRENILDKADEIIYSFDNLRI